MLPAWLSDDRAAAVRDRRILVIRRAISYVRVKIDATAKSNRIFREKIFREESCTELGST